MLGLPRSSQADTDRLSALLEVGRQLWCQPEWRYRRLCSPPAPLGPAQPRCCPGEPCPPCGLDSGQEPRWPNEPGRGSDQTRSSGEDHARDPGTMQPRLLSQALRQRLQLRPQSHQVLSYGPRKLKIRALTMLLGKGLWINKQRTE